MVALGCLNGREEWGVGQGRYPYKYECYSEHEYFKGVDKRRDSRGGFLLAAQGFTLGNVTGESYCLDWGVKSGLRDTCVSQGFIYSSRAESEAESVSYRVTNPNGASPERVKTCS